MYTPGMEGGWYTQGVYKVVYTRVVCLLLYHGGYIPPCTCYTLYHPGYTTYLACRWSLYYTPGVLHEVQDDEALGSTLGISLGMRRREAPFFLSC